MKIGIILDSKEIIERIFWEKQKGNISAINMLKI